MASEEDHAVYNDDDLDDDDDNEPLNDVVLEDDDEDDVVGDDSDSDTEDADPDADTNSTSSIIPVTAATPAAVLSATRTAAVLDSSVVTLAIPAAVHNGNTLSSALAAASMAATTKITTPTVTPEAKRHRIDDPASEKITSQRPPSDDSRRLFQRLWTDEDEIELLQGFLDYTSQRGMTSSGHHHDTSAFYDQIKSKLQLDFNKNQLVEKLRRLKKKYRNIVNRISSGKDFVFKSIHDQTTFELSRKIWSNSAIMNRQEFDDEDQNPNPSLTISNILPNSFNLNNSNTNSDHKAILTTNALVNIDINSTDKSLMSTPRPRKRSRVKMEEKSPKVPTLGPTEPPPVANPSSTQGLIEETVRSCMSPLLKELINNAVNGSVLGGGGGSARGIGGLVMNAIPLNFSGVSLRGGGGEMVDDKWRKQQILELEVYSKRLELVQDQIKSTLEELRSSTGS